MPSLEQILFWDIYKNTILFKRSLFGLFSMHSCSKIISFLFLVNISSSCYLVLDIQTIALEMMFLKKYFFLEFGYFFPFVSQIDLRWPVLDKIWRWPCSRLGSSSRPDKAVRNGPKLQIGLKGSGYGLVFKPNDSFQDTFIWFSSALSN